MVERLLGKRGPNRMFLAGFVLALLGAAAATLKWLLTHQ
jgi:hypothetical protein